ncbi:MAG: hypothetical protein EHM17_11185 [Verrucomicrobiaceae bacterium]|nr:MAG: hypothetical protein EHM17_16335 [Verrucomicrobiaceae bacterium]RPJ33171.1 MAG: hypothetical protein EHM17_11185 [Verrucomicrobiaceae bacterium]
MQVQDRINKAKIAIMRHPRFCRYAGIMACGKLTITDTIPTAATDGWNVMVNPEFVSSLTDPQLRLLILHEQQHKAYRHLRVWRSLINENAQLANIAMDHFVNLTLMDMNGTDDFLAMPALGVQPEPKYRGWSVGRIFADLKKNPPPTPPQSFDEHLPDNAPPPDADTSDADTSDAAQQAFDDKRIKEIDQALRQGEILAKRRAAQMGLDNTPSFGELLHPARNWREVLREFVSETCTGRDEATWRRPNRRYLDADIYLPSMVSTTMTRLAVVFDTSGSCFGTDIATRFVSELAVIIEQVKPTYVDVMYVDTRVAAHQTFEHGQFAVADLQPRGGGGTDLPVAFDYMHAKNIKPDACVVLTDGETPFGTPPGYPVLWALTSLTIRPPYGTTVHIGD